MGTTLKFIGVPLGVLFLCNSVICQDSQVTSVEAKGDDPQPTHRLVSLKHRRYKSYRDNTTDPHVSLPSTLDPSSSPSIPIIHHEHIHEFDIPNPHIKSPRNGFQLQKSPPDLQFGLAFTVPFISLSTEKLLNTVSGKNYDSVSSLLKLNFSGLLLAAVVGLVAAAAIFLPSFLNHGGVPPPWLDGIIPHFQEQGYNDYGNNGWDKGKWNDYNKPDYGRRNGRAESTLNAIGVGVLKLVEKFKTGVSSVEKCAVQRVCNDKKQSKKTPIIELVTGMTDNEVVRNVGVVKIIRKVIEGDTSVCAKVEGLEYCNEFVGVEDSFVEILNGWREKEKGDGKSGGE